MHPRMTPTVMTAWRRVPEGRSARWEPMPAMRCRWDDVKETRAGVSGDTASWTAEISLPSASDEAPLEIGDRVALGATAEQEPPGGAFEVVNCRPVYLGGPHPHHWEATAR